MKKPCELKPYDQDIQKDLAMAVQIEFRASDELVRVKEGGWNENRQTSEKFKLWELEPKRIKICGRTWK